MTNPSTMKAIGTLLVLVGFALLLPGFFTLTAIGAVYLKLQTLKPLGPTSTVLTYAAAAAVATAAGVWLFRTGAAMRVTARKLMAVDGWTLLERDRRPPILYLRSFVDDEKVMARRSPSVGASGGVAGGAAAGLITALLGTSAGAYETQEEELTKVLEHFGPVVAVGDPSEDLPDLGAARVYFDDRWQDNVMSLMQRSLIVVFRVGAKTPGFWWEVERVLQLLPPERLVFWIPAASSASEDPRTNYQGFVAQLTPMLPCALPAWRDRGTFLKFDPAWSGAHLMRLGSFKNRPGRAMIAQLIPAEPVSTSIRRT